MDAKQKHSELQRCTNRIGFWAVWVGKGVRTHYRRSVQATESPDSSYRWSALYSGPIMAVGDP
jgi:hypothetical protein